MTHDIGEDGEPPSPDGTVLTPDHASLRPVGPRRWRATEAAESAEPSRWTGLRRALFGRPIPSGADLHERLDKKRALAVFASDALSSTAYATEEILLVLVLAGTAYLYVATPVAIAIAMLLAIVIVSYRQTVHAYPEGGGAYAVAADNLGRRPALVAAAALLTDYVLTAAVSMSAGTLAIISAIPALQGLEVLIALLGVALVTAINLRGVREAGAVLGVLVYVFIGCFALMLIVGLTRLAVGGIGEASLGESAPPPEGIAAIQALSLLLVLRAFSSGATALTGIEAIANGVRVFRPPEARNAATTMAVMGVILATFFTGATFLSVRLGVAPQEGQSVIAQVGRQVFDGAPVLFYLLQASTATVLVLAANTAFNGFPQLAAILARDGFAPRRFGFRDDRLTYSAGIVLLALVSAVLLAAFQADTHRLIPLYAVGVFVSFTISQAGMVKHWSHSGRRHLRSIAINGTGALATGAVAVVVAGTKFTSGAWMVVLIVPALIWLLSAIHRHYEEVGRLLALDDGVRLRPRARSLSLAPVVVPVRRLDRLAFGAVEYARSISADVTAVHLTRTADAATEAFVERWQRLVPDVPLVILESPYRTFISPFFAYVDALPRRPEDVVTLVVPELEITYWWERLLHNSTAALIARGAAKRPHVIVTSATKRPAVGPHPGPGGAAAA
ncbi:MAG: APC family permease [Dehalococcoidia bacterium]|nr:APC family permease [Dehalococcoidia bacterium]